MKYSIEAAVEGDLYLEAPKTVVAIDRPGVRYEFRSDDKGRVNVIAVVLEVPPAAAATMHATFGPSRATPAARLLSHSMSTPPWTKQLGATCWLWNQS